jgi:hypothetical protein
MTDEPSRLTEEAGKPEEAGEPEESGLAAGTGQPGESGPAAGTREPPESESAPATGEPRVDEALAMLAGLGEVPGTEHVEAFEHVHDQLHGILDEVGEQGNSGDSAPREPGGP